jgi:hypothetical protein
LGVSEKPGFKGISKAVWQGINDNILTVESAGAGLLQGASYQEAGEGQMIKEHLNDDGETTLEYCCDFCSFSTAHNKAPTKFTPIMECDACGRHVCSGHRKYYKESWVDSHKGMYCIECWDLGEKYRDKMISVQNEAWEKENDLRLAWHREGRARKRSHDVDASKTKKELHSTLS